jgi:hypothetical protein
MRRVLLAAVLAGCAGPPEKQPLEHRELAAGQPLMPELTCVAVEMGRPCRVTVRNENRNRRHLVYYVKWRTGSGDAVKVRDSEVRELIVQGRETAVIELEPPGDEAVRFELLVGDKP